MKFINQKIGVFFWKLIVAFPINFQNVLANILFSFFKNPYLKRNIFSRKNIDAAFPNLNEQEKINLFNRKIKSFLLKRKERKTRLELATPTLARLCSTN